MSDMVERVRRAIIAADLGDLSDGADYEAMARAAIEAMREPTEAMIALFDDEDRRFATYCWDAFIAEVLK